MNAEDDFDRETKALSECATALKGLSAVARTRVLKYLAIRIEEDLQSERQFLNCSITEIKGWIDVERGKRKRGRPKKELPL